MGVAAAAAAGRRRGSKLTDLGAIFGKPLFHGLGGVGKYPNGECGVSEISFEIGTGGGGGGVMCMTWERRNYTI